MENGILDRAAYESLLGMVNSPDPGNWTVAIEILENLDVKPSLVWILLLMKNSMMSPHLSVYCPKITKQLEAMSCGKLWGSSYSEICFFLAVTRQMSQIYLLIQEYEKEKGIKPNISGNINNGWMLTS